MLSGLYACWRRSSRGHTWLPVDLRAGPGQSESPHPLPCPWNVRCPLFPQWELFQRHSLGRAGFCWDHLDGMCDWAQLRPLYINSEDSGRWVRRSTYLVAAQDTKKVRMNFPLLLKPAIYQSGHASFLGLSLPSVYRGQFANQQCHNLRR